MLFLLRPALLLAPFALSLASAAPAIAQIIPDSTVSTQVDQTGNDFTITGGAERGANLFHSFSDFSVPTGGSAVFNNGGAIANIFSRVTGSSPSSIDGFLSTNGNASLFLLNPNGVLFGPNASLNIGGSFFATSADSVQFGDGTVYGIQQTTPSSLLTISAPIGLQLGQNPGAIRAIGNGQDIIVNQNVTFTGPLTRIPDAVAHLEARSGQTLALVGGDVVLQGSSLRANGGRIELGSVDGGLVRIRPVGSGWSLGYDSIANYRDVHLKTQSALDASGVTSGGIQIAGRNVDVLDGSVVLVQVSGPSPQSSLTIAATDQVTVRGFHPPSLLQGGVRVETLNAGQFGPLAITATNLDIGQGGELVVTNAGISPGNSLDVSLGGNLTIVGGGLPEFPLVISRMLVLNAGISSSPSLEIAARRVSVANSALLGAISVSPSPLGTGGNITLNAAESLEIIGPSTANAREALGLSFVSTSTLGPADSGNIEIQTSRLALTSGSNFVTTTSSSGNAGSIAINASDSVSITSDSELETAINSGAFSGGGSVTLLQTILGLPTETTGDGGEVLIRTPRLMLDGAEANVSVSNLGTGRAGTLDIDAGTVELRNKASLSAGTLSGEGGNLRLRATEQLLLRSEGRVSATAGGSGNGGNVEVRSPVVVAFPKENSDIGANAVGGNGGNVRIETQALLGLQFRPQSTEASDVTASSQFGLSGTVSISDFTLNPNAGLFELETNPVDSTQTVVQGCAALNSSFATTGRGGIPSDPSQQSQSDRPWNDLRDLSAFRRSAAQQTASSNEHSQGRSPLIEATGWQENLSGDITLTTLWGNSEQIAPYQACLEQAVSQEGIVASTITATMPR